MAKRIRSKNLVNNASLKRRQRLDNSRRAKKITTKTHSDGVGGGSGKPARKARKFGRR